MSYTIKRVNAWTLRCIFNQSRIVERQFAGEFSSKLKKSRTPGTRPLGTKSELWVYTDRAGNEVAKAHRYVDADGIASPLDPKSVKIDNIRYLLHVSKVRANPERLLPFVSLQRCYGWIERKRCELFGAIAVVPPT